MPFWSLGIQLESKQSLEFLESKYLTHFQAFCSDDKLLTSNGHKDTEE